MLETFLASTSVVALAEVGDKTQLLSLVLAAKYRKPVPIALGVLCATLLSHASAGGVGALCARFLNQTILNWAVVGSFALMAGWVLVPDKLDKQAVPVAKRSMGVFAATAIAFFLAEMGDKTQIATAVLAAQFHAFFTVVAGTTLGMMIANLPVIYLGHRFADRLPVRVVHVIGAILCAILGGIAIAHAWHGQATHP